MFVKFDANNAANNLYAATEKRIAQYSELKENPFAGARTGLGIGDICFTDIGQQNGEPPTEYYTNKNGYYEVVTRTLDYYG